MTDRRLVTREYECIEPENTDTRQILYPKGATQLGNKREFTSRGARIRGTFTQYNLRASDLKRRQTPKKR